MGVLIKRFDLQPQCSDDASESVMALKAEGGFGLSVFCVIVIGKPKKQSCTEAATTMTRTTRLMLLMMMRMTAAL